jgi:hypothetical protein
MDSLDLSIEPMEHPKNIERKINRINRKQWEKIQFELPITKTFIFNYLYNQRKKGKAPITLIVGDPRSGKTFLALALAHALDKLNGKEFDMKRQMHFDILTFAESFATQDVKGRTMILDEASVEIDSHSTSSVESKVFARLNDTQAYRGTLIIIILPYASSLGLVHRKKVKMVMSVLANGKFTTYYCSHWNADLRNDRNIRQETMETIYGGPTLAPPKEIQKEYLNHFQDKFKSEILRKQIDILKTKRDGLGSGWKDQAVF